MPVDAGTESVFVAVALYWNCMAAPAEAEESLTVR